MSDLTDKTMEELKEEAKNLELEFKGNISRSNLEKMIEDKYNESLEESKVTVKSLDPIQVIVNNTPKKDKKSRLRELVAEAKAKAFKLRKVSLTLNDKRDQEVTTAVYLGFENQYFSRDRIVPLDIPLELEECLVEVARMTKITLHRDEIINGRRTGNKIHTPTNKFNIQYLD